MLQQWEATLQHQQHEFSIQQQQHDIAMQRRWEQLQREYAVQQQPNYNPYGPQLPYWSPPVGHSSGPDLYQSAPQQPRPVFEPKKHQRPLDSSGEVLPLSKSRLMTMHAICYACACLSVKVKVGCI